MKSTVAEKWLTPDGALPTGFWPQSELVRFIPQDIHDAALAAAKAEGMREGMLKAAEIAKPKSKVKQKHGRWETGANEASAASHARATEIEDAIRAAAGAKP